MFYAVPFILKQYTAEVQSIGHGLFPSNRVCVHATHVWFIKYFIPSAEWTLLHPFSVRFKQP